MRTWVERVLEHRGKLPSSNTITKCFGGWLQFDHPPGFVEEPMTTEFPDPTFGIVGHKPCRCKDYSQTFHEGEKYCPAWGRQAAQCAEAGTGASFVGWP